MDNAQVHTTPPDTQQYVVHTVHRHRHAVNTLHPHEYTHARRALMSGLHTCAQAQYDHRRATHVCRCTAHMCTGGPHTRAQHRGTHVSTHVCTRTTHTHIWVTHRCRCTAHTRAHCAPPKSRSRKVRLGHRAGVLGKPPALACSCTAAWAEPAAPRQGSPLHPVSPPPVQTPPPRRHPGLGLAWVTTSRWSGCGQTCARVRMRVSSARDTRIQSLPSAGLGALPAPLLLK